VTTHDVELQESLYGHFELYHFLENPDIEGYFDFRLRRGAAAERNAIRLLARLGFPEEVVEKALNYSRSNPN
jgi:DNA mismatch repair ATPase MutS